MRITPTPITAALAGAFSALVWPQLWSRFGANPNGDGMALIVGTLVAIALPAHAFVVGFGRDPAQDGRALDVGLLKRIGAWLAGAAATAAAMAMLKP